MFTEREYTVVAGTVVDIFDLSDATRTHVVTQADPAKQVLPPAMHADFLRPCYNFTGPQQYISNAGAPYWGTYQIAGGFICTIGTPTATGVRVWWETTDNFAVPYLLHYQNTASPHWRAECKTAAGAGAVSAFVGTLAVNTPVMTRVRWTYPTLGAKATGATEVTSALVTPPAGDPSRGFAISRLAAPLSARLPVIAMFPPSADMAAAQAALTALYGVAA